MSHSHFFLFDHAPKLLKMAEYPSLPPLPSDFAEMKGPISTSNWVIPGKLIAGSYPGSADEKKHKLKITNIIQCGI